MKKTVDKMVSVDYINISNSSYYCFGKTGECI